MGKNQSGEFSIYFKCNNCSQEFSLYSFRIAVFLYGMILLANEQNAYMGITCPKCMKTTLTKIEKARLEEIGKELGERIIITYDLTEIFGFEVSARYVGKPGPQSVSRASDIYMDNMERYDESRSSVNSTLAVQVVSTLKYERLDTEPAHKNSINAWCHDSVFHSRFELCQHWPGNDKEKALWHEDLNEISNHHAQYTLCSRPIKVPAEDPLCLVYWFKEDDVHILVALENKDKLKIFPRHFYDGYIRKLCENFLVKSGLWFKRYPGIKELEKRQKNCFSKHSAKEKLSVNSGFIETLEHKDFLDLDDSDGGIGSSLWKLKDPFKDKDVPSSSKDIDLAALEQQTRDIDRQRMISDIWSNFAEDHVQELLSKMSFEFALEFQHLKRRQDCSTGAIWELEQKYLKDIYDSLSSPTKMQEMTKQTRPVTLKAVKKAEEKFKGVEIITQDHQINKIKIDIPDYVRSENGRIDILILGETGTGKDLIAQACHEASGREGQFISVNALAISSTVFESEVFGHAKGAFTDAKTERKGKFKEANMGTIFLDEIGEMDIELQSKLLRVIENREIQPLGKDRTEKVDVIIIMATNCNLRKRIREGKFREDLYYRIDAGASIEIPPLRDRKGDIPLLINHFIQKTDWKRKNNSTLPELKVSQDCLKVLKKMPWKGNVRELEAMVGKIVKNRIREKNRSEITEGDIPHLYIQEASSLKKIKSRKADGRFYSDNEIISAIRKHNGNKTRAAKEIGCSPRTVFRRTAEMEAN